MLATASAKAPAPAETSREGRDHWVLVVIAIFAAIAMIP